jgi:hypothetical protein
LAMSIRSDPRIASTPVVVRVVESEAGLLT